MTDEEITLAALSDPDAQPLTDAQLARMRRVSKAMFIRRQIPLSRAEFAARYHIPLAQLEAWERHEVEPDAVAMAYLALIAADPDGVAATLVKQAMPAQAAE